MVSALMPSAADFPDTSGVSQDVGNVYQQRPSLLYHLFMNESPEKASYVHPSKYLKVSPESEGPCMLQGCKYGRSRIV